MSKTIMNLLPRLAENRSNGKLNSTQLIGTGGLALGILLPSFLLALPGVALRLSNGQVFFNHPPQLIRAATSVAQTDVSGATYHFTLKVPEDAGEPLQAVTIAQRQTGDTVVFREGKSRAFAGDSFAGGSNLGLASVGGPQPLGSNEETVVFDSPVLPGSTVTVALKPERNPERAGTYLFGVTAYPVGKNSPGQFLGHGRLHFYDNNR